MIKQDLVKKIYWKKHQIDLWFNVIYRTEQYSRSTATDSLRESVWFSLMAFYPESTQVSQLWPVLSKVGGYLLQKYNLCSFSMWISVFLFQYRPWSVVALKESLCHHIYSSYMQNSCQLWLGKTKQLRDFLYKTQNSRYHSLLMTHQYS